MSEFQRPEGEIGALWSKQGKKGAYFTGEVTIDGKTTKIVCFQTKKSSERAPDYRILKSVPREQAAPVTDDDVVF